MNDCPHKDESTGESYHKYDDDGFCIFCGNTKPLGVYLDSDQRANHFPVAGTQRPNPFL